MIVKGGNLSERIFALALYITVKKGMLIQGVRATYVFCHHAAYFRKR